MSGKGLGLQGCLGKYVTSRVMSTHRWGNDT